MKERRRHTAHLVAVTRPDDSVQVYAVLTLTRAEACAAVAALVPGSCSVALAGALSQGVARWTELKRGEVQLI